jgi:hypothetical protein
MTRRARWRLMLLGVLLLVGCASATPSRESQRGSTSPRVRCLANPQREASEGTRPLFFFFCMESP